jgi:hypothetical protein
MSQPFLLSDYDNITKNSLTQVFYLFLIKLYKINLMIKLVINACLIGITCFPAGLNAQINVKPVNGIVKNTSLTTLEDVDTSVPGNIYRHYMKRDDKVFSYLIERLNQDLTPVFRNEVPCVDHEDFFEIKLVNDKVFLFTTLYDLKDKTLWLTVLDNNNGKIVREKTKLGSMQSDLMGTNGRKFSVSVSPDNTKMLVVSAFQWPKKPQEVKAEVYDLATFKIINTVELPALDNTIMIKTSDYVLSNEGNLLYFFIPDIKEKDAPKNTKIVIYDAQSKTNTITNLTSEKMIAKNFQVFQKDNNWVITGAFCDNYSKSDKRNNMSGVFCILINKNKQLTPNFHYFSPEVETKLAYKNAERQRELYEKEFTIKDIIKTDKGFYLIENLTYAHEFTDGNDRSYITFGSREYIVSKFDYNGKLDFVSVIPKFTSDELYQGTIVLSNNNLYVFYCDDAKNLERYTIDNFEPKEYVNAKKAHKAGAVCVKVDPTGKLSRQVLYMNDENCSYNPRNSVFIKEKNGLVVNTNQKGNNVLQFFEIKP